jgi:hypothetical protein
MPEEEKHNAADPEAVARQEEQARIQRQQELEDMRQILSTMAGVRLFRRMVRVGRVMSTSVTNENPYYTYFNEGARNLVNYFLADVIAVSPDKFNLLLTNDNSVPAAKPKLKAGQ